MKRKKLINKFSLPANAGWPGTQNKTAMPSTITPLFRKVILCTLLPLLLLGAVKTAAQDYSRALVNVENVTDDGSLELRGAISVTTAEIAGTTYLFVAGFTDDGVSVFRVDDGGMLAHVHNVTDDGILELDNVLSITTAVVDGTTYLFVAGYRDDGVSVFRVDDGGLLANVENVPDDGILELNGARSVTTAEIAGTTYLFVAGYDDDGVSVFSVANNGLLANVTNVPNDATLELAGASSVTTAVAGSTTYLFVAGASDDGVSVFSVANNGLLTGRANVDDADDSNWELDGAISVTTAEIAGTTYLFVSGFIDDGVSVFRVANDDGMLVNVTNVTDAGSLELDGAQSVTTAEIAGTTYLFVAGYDDDGVSVFSVANNGLLTSVTNVTDVGSLELDGANSVTTAVVADTTYLFVAGYLDDGVSVFRVEDAAAPTFGSQTASDQTFALCADVSLQLPEATSGNGTLTYTLTPAIPGLTFDPVARVLSGTPATPSAAVALTYTVTDQDYNRTDADSPSLTFMVTVSADNIAPDPDMTSLSALTGQCSVTLAMAMAAAPIATDNCDTGTIPGTTDAAPFPITTNSTITWTFTDATGNTTTQDQQVVVDMTGPAPVEASLSALTGECSVTMAMAMAAAPTATDNCDTGTITGTTDAASFPITANSTITWTYEDSEGNTTTQDQQVTLMDVTGPAPEEDPLLALTGECSVTLAMAMAAAPTATDNCDATPTATTDAAPFPITTTSTITWTYEDSEGNTTTQEQQVTLMDVTGPAPVEASLSPLTGECSVTMAMAMAAAPTATDNCDAGSITGTTDAASFPITANSMITWTFTDMTGNGTTQTQQVTITPDMTGPAPVEASLSPLTGECSVTMAMAMAAAPTATDNCDAGSITGTTDAASFPITANSMITWTFTDMTGNGTTQTQQVTITPDMTGPAPVEASLSPLTGECSVTMAMAMAAAPTATDNCDTGTITGTTDAASFPITANSTITWTYEDSEGNTTTQEQQVTLMDVTAPVPEVNPLPALTGECMVNMPAAPTATDNCDAGIITGTTTTNFPVTATSVITWTYEDNEGNMATQTQQVTLNCISPLGVEEEPGISMYPNPSEGSLAFSTGNYGSLSVKIYRIDGALVFAGITRDTTPINIETLAAGSYVVQAAANGTTVFTSRLLKRD